MTVDCMACLVNLARGLGDDHDVVVETGYFIHHEGVTHATVYAMGPGTVRAACRYERVVLTVKGHYMWRARSRP